MSEEIGVTGVEAEGTVPEGEPGDHRGHRMEEGLRWFGDFFFRPFLWLFGTLGLSPNIITLLGVALAFGAGYFLASMRVPVAAVLFALSGIVDLVDGYVAKKLDRVTVFGSFLDSFSDRLSDAAIYIGLMIYYLRLGEGLYVGLSLFLLVASFLISYIRAKAESLGVSGKAGLMARPARFLSVGFGLFFNGLSPWVLRMVLWIVSALLLETLVERFWDVWKALKE